MSQGNFDDDADLEAAQQELEGAWTTINELRAREEALKEKIEVFQADSEELRAELREKAAQDMVPADDMNELIRSKKVLGAEVEVDVDHRHGVNSRDDG